MLSYHPPLTFNPHHKMNLLELPLDLFLEILLINTNISQIINLCKAIPQKEFQTLFKSSRVWRPLLLKHYDAFKPQIFALEQDNPNKSQNFHLTLYKKFHRNVLFNSDEFKDLYSHLTKHSPQIQFVENSKLSFIPLQSVYRSTKLNITHRSRQNFNLEVKLPNYDIQIHHLSKTPYLYTLGNSSFSGSLMHYNSQTASTGPILKSMITIPICQTITFRFGISYQQVEFDKRIEFKILDDTVADDDDDECGCMCGGCHMD